MDALVALNRKIGHAGELQSLVRTVKAVAAAGMRESEEAARSLSDYDRTVQLGLAVCLRGMNLAAQAPAGKDPAHPVSAIVIGSDMGLVGRFNESLADFVRSELARRPGRKTVWVLGERVWRQLGDAFPLGRLLAVPASAPGIGPAISELLALGEPFGAGGAAPEVLLFHHRATPPTLHEPVVRRLLPLDRDWQRPLLDLPWPTRNQPEAFGRAFGPTFAALLREYLFVSLFRACAESLSSENASRLAAMQRASRNLEKLLGELRRTYHRLRQDSIDSELFDVIAGFEALPRQERATDPQEMRSKGAFSG